MYCLLDNPRSTSDLSAWGAIAGGFSQLVGWTSFGDLLLRDPDDGRYGFMRLGRPVVVPLKHIDPVSFRREFLAPDKSYLRAEDAAELEGRLGKLGPEEVYVPAPGLRPSSLNLAELHREGVFAWAARAAAYYGIGKGQASDAVLPHLGLSDDFNLWRVALAHILSEFQEAPGVLIEVGRCSHWLRPHQTRWTADGGFAWPTGYGSGTGGYSRGSLPQFDWSVTLAWKAGGWEIARDKSPRLALRVTIPSRTLRHRQAAAHTVWTTDRGKEVRFYGFRRRQGEWRCTAESESAEERSAKRGHGKKRSKGHRRRGNMDV